jgi:hypothetical protein
VGHGPDPVLVGDHRQQLVARVGEKHPGVVADESRVTTRDAGDGLEHRDQGGASGAGLDVLELGPAGMDGA